MIHIRKKKAFTLIEIIIGMAMFMMVLLSIFMMNQSSNQSSMDAYYEILAFSLAREPIEVFRGLGYDTVVKICRDNNLSPALYKVGEFTAIEYNPGIELQYPAEAENFQRKIELKESVSENGSKYVNITVTVAVKGQSKAENWLSRKSVILQSCIMERPKW